MYAHSAKPTKDTLRIDECIQFFNGVTNWVVCNILKEITMTKRGQIIEKFIEATRVKQERGKGRREGEGRRRKD